MPIIESAPAGAGGVRIRLLTDALPAQPLFDDTQLRPGNAGDLNIALTIRVEHAHGGQQAQIIERWGAA